MKLHDLADACRKSGLPVVEETGWRARGHGAMRSVEAVVVHHTAGPATGDAPSLRVVRDGRPDLRGPLAHIVLARSGTVHVVAAGLCWHAGPTHEPWQGNAHAIGIEAEHVGTPGVVWTAVQYDAYVRLARALADHYGVPYARILGHREVAKPAGRKSDPTFDLATFRAAVAGETSRPTLRRRDQGPAVEELHRILGLVEQGEPGFGLFGPRTEAAVTAFQRAHGLVPDGICGQKTWAALLRTRG